MLIYCIKLDHVLYLINYGIAKDGRITDYVRQELQPATFVRENSMQQI